MRKAVWVSALLLAATPLLAQEEEPQAPFAGGGGGAQVFSRVDSVNPMEQVKAFLAKASIMLNSDQERTLRPAVEAAIKQLQDISDRFAARGERRGGGERRGRGVTAGIAALANGPAAQELKRMNDELMAKINSVLKPDQQAAFKKFQNDEIKKGGGFAALKVVMEEAGAPLTAEQEPQIQGLYSEDANKGQIVGTVYDPVQAVVPNAKVQVQNKATGAVREFTTGPEGQFRAILLDAGSYDVRVDAQGFARRVYQNVTVNVGSAVSLDVTLQLGGAELEINVADTFLPIDLPNPTTTIDMTSIEDLPINGRRFQDFATLTPTVQVDQERDQLSFHVQRAINANVMVDGSDYNNPFFGGIRGGER